MEGGGGGVAGDKACEPVTVDIFKETSGQFVAAFVRTKSRWFLSLNPK